MYWIKTTFLVTQNYKEKTNDHLQNALVVIVDTKICRGIMNPMYKIADHHSVSSCDS